MMLVLLLNEKIYRLTLTIRNLEALKQMGKGIDYFLSQIPTTQELALFFTIALQSSNLEVGYAFIDDCYEEGKTFHQLLEMIPQLLTKVGMITDSPMEDEESGPSFSFEDLIQYHLKRMAQYGLTEEQFYNLTLGEVRRMAESFHLQQRERLKEQAEMDYIQAGLITSNISSILSDKNKAPLLEEVYGHLYTEDEKEKMKATREKHQQERMRQELQANMLAWVGLMNAKRKNQMEKGTEIE